jgi:hypothetical protein
MSNATFSTLVHASKRGLLIIRNSAIGALISVIVLLGTGAGADAVTDPRLRPGRSHTGYRHITVNVYGSNNVIATDGSVLTIGRLARVNANTGGVSSSGTLGIDTDKSSLESGAATTGVPVASHTRFEPSAGGMDPVRRVVKRIRARRAPKATGRGMAISGYEDHSVLVRGEGQLAVYDDSNLFVNRTGKINGNTGDTDSSGLNAVDVSGSTVRSGNHIEDAENDDGPENEGDAGSTRTAGPAGTRSVPERHASSSVTDEGESRANGATALTIGGDGYDNLGIKVRGRRNIAAYDDSNVVVGGTGAANSQIGDSDTSGVVVMGIHKSQIQSGSST